MPERLLEEASGELPLPVDNASAESCTTGDAVRIEPHTSDLREELQRPMPLLALHACTDSCPVRHRVCHYATRLHLIEPHHGMLPLLAP